MSAAGTSFRLAPAGVVRAAAWPLSCLSRFGDPDLGRNAYISTTQFERDYEHVLEREREHLWTMTLEDARFRKALALASPSAYARALSAQARRASLRNRAMRIAEHTLYRYLARAAGRATPNGLWAGVTEVRFGERGSVEAISPRHAYAPDLRPFQALLRGLAMRPEYRDRARWCLNPTIHAHADGGWQFFSRMPDGTVVHRAIDPHAALARLLPMVSALPPMCLDELTRELFTHADWPHGSRQDLHTLINALAEAGALIGGMDLPTKFETPWQALERASENLAAGDRAPWNQTLSELHDRCDALAGATDLISPDEFVERLERSRRCVESLGEAYGLPSSVGDDSVLRCDLHLPWRVTLGQAERRALHDALSDYERAWLHGASPAGAEREQARTALARRIGNGVPLGEAVRIVAEHAASPGLFWPAAAEVADPALQARLRAWEGCLDMPGPETVLSAHAPDAPRAVSPLGSLFVALSANRPLTVRSVTDLPTMASARYGHILDDATLNGWLAAEFAASAARSGIAPLEMRVPFEGNPNVLAAPSLLQDSIEPWSASTDSLPLANARVCVHAPSGRLVLELDRGRQARAVLTLGAADLRSRDPLSQLLLHTGFHEFPNRRSRAIDVPTASEMARARFSPRVMLPGGAVLRTRRSMLTAELAQLTRVRGAERFRAWRLCAERYGWPEHLRVSAGPGEAMRIHRDSPLGVEALFKGIGPRTPFLVVEEAGPDDGVCTPGGDVHVAELALAFARDVTP